MKRSIVTAVAVIGLAASVAGCGGGRTTAAPAAAPAAQAMTHAAVPSPVPAPAAGAAPGSAASVVPASSTTVTRPVAAAPPAPVSAPHRTKVAKGPRQPVNTDPSDQGGFFAAPTPTPSPTPQPAPEWRVQPSPTPVPAPTPSAAQSACMAQHPMPAGDARPIGECDAAGAWHLYPGMHEAANGYPDYWQQDSTGPCYSNQPGFFPMACPPS